MTHLNARDMEVRTVPLQEVRDLVKQYHYTRGGSNTATYRHGLFRRGDDLLLGAAWWIPTTKSAALSVSEDWRGGFSPSPGWLSYRGCPPTRRLTSWEGLCGLFGGRGDSTPSLHTRIRGRTITGGYTTRQTGSMWDCPRGTLAILTLRLDGMWPGRREASPAPARGWRTLATCGRPPPRSTSS